MQLETKIAMIETERVMSCLVGGNERQEDVLYEGVLLGTMIRKEKLRIISS